MLSALSPENLLGEMAVLRKGVRTAAAAAIEEAEFYRLDAETFAVIAREHGSLRQFVQPGFATPVTISMTAHSSSVPKMAK